MRRDSTRSAQARALQNNTQQTHLEERVDQRRDGVVVDRVRAAAAAVVGAVVAVTGKRLGRRAVQVRERRLVDGLLFGVFVVRTSRATDKRRRIRTIINSHTHLEDDLIGRVLERDAHAAALVALARVERPSLFFWGAGGGGSRGCVRGSE